MILKREDVKNEYFIIGANGGVGSRLVQQLKSDNIDFTAGCS